MSDFTLDWNLTGADGSATLNSTTSSDTVDVTVSTPTNSEGREFWLNSNGSMESYDVEEPTEIVVTFDEAVTNLSFQVKDVDSDGHTWDDKVTVLAYDENGNLVDVTFSDLQAGQTVDGNSVEGSVPLGGEALTVTVSAPIVKLVIVHDNGDSEDDSGRIKIQDLTFDKAVPGDCGGEGFVEGTGGDDLIDAAYTGDPEGDMIDNGDAVLPGEGPDDDIVLAGAGDDTVIAGEGDDVVLAGSGADVVLGQNGDDLIYGDKSCDNDGPVVREVLEWNEVPGYADEQNVSSFTQNTGNVDVTFNIDSNVSSAVEWETNASNDDDIETGGLGPVDATSNMSIEAEDFGDSAAVSLDFSKDVTNVDFRINDIDSDSEITVYAYDADGNKVEVILTPGAGLALSDTDGINGPDTATSDGGLEPSWGDSYSLRVQIEGPISRIEILHNNTDGASSHIQVTDVYFDVTESDTGEDGNDTLDGGEGDDTIYGEGGDDSIIGGNGSDLADGGDGDDIIDTSGKTPASDYGWPGVIPPDPYPNDDLDTVHGGAGNDIIWTGDDRDVITGGTGNDTIDGGLDDDTIDGGADDDFIIGGHGSDEIDGGSGNDEIWGGMGPGTDPFNIKDDDPIFPDPVPINGMDVIHGGDGDDTIMGQDDDDVLYGDAGNDVMDGGIDEDHLFGGDGEDTMEGGHGDDTLEGGAGNDMMSGGDDRDLFQHVNAGDDVDGGAGGDDWDTLDLTGSEEPGGSFVVTKTGPDSNGNGWDGYVTYYDSHGNETGTLNFTEIEEIIPCFTPGTMIATPKGEKPVEKLQEGDRVITRDNGIQEIRWVGHKDLGWRALMAQQHLKPVLIQAGALGNGLPERDMLVSPNHRVLVANDRTALYFEEREVLASAKHLVDNKGVHRVDTMGTSYIHFMFDHHEVVLSNGAWTESFQPGDYSLKGVGNAQRTEIFELFPELETAQGIEDYTAARRTLKKHEAKMLLK